MRAEARGGPGRECESPEVQVGAAGRSGDGGGARAEALPP